MEHIDQNAVLSLAKQAVAGQLSPERFYQSLTQAITALMGCSRASLWRYTSVAKDEIVCLNLFDALKHEHRSGDRLQQQTLTPYFDAIRQDGMVVASHARRHPSTRCFTEHYFQPNDIHSLLDVGVNVAGVPYGLFCCEQVGGIKEWNEKDVDILRTVGTLCGMAFKRIESAGHGL